MHDPVPAKEREQAGEAFEATGCFAGGRGVHGMCAAFLEPPSWVRVAVWRCSGLLSPQARPFARTPGRTTGENEVKVGLIGTGLLGRALAGRLLNAGMEVHGFDVSEAALEAAEALGVMRCASAAAAAKGKGTLLFSLPDSSCRRELLWGAPALAESLAPDTVILDTTTGRPKDLVEDHGRLMERGVRLLDCCILGSSEEVTRNEASALVAGTPGDEPQATLCGAFSKAVYYFGEPGMASKAKLVANLVLGLNRLVLAEGLALARKTGLNEEQMLEALKTGGRLFEGHGQQGGAHAGGSFREPCGTAGSAPERRRVDGRIVGRKRRTHAAHGTSPRIA